jgi:hypothetical protein
MRTGGSMNATAAASTIPAAAELRRAWISAVELFEAGDDLELLKLQQASARFLDSDWLPIAIAQRWDELEIWGCFPAPLEFARRRYDALGLVPSLITGRGCTLAEIGPDFALVTRRESGARLRHQRALGGRQWARPWWQAFEPRKENDDVAVGKEASNV